MQTAATKEWTDHFFWTTRKVDNHLGVDIIYLLCESQKKLGNEEGAW